MFDVCADDEAVIGERLTSVGLFTSPLLNIPTTNINSENKTKLLLSDFLVLVGLVLHKHLTVPRITTTIPVNTLLMTAPPLQENLVDSWYFHLRDKLSLKHIFSSQQKSMETK